MSFNPVNVQSHTLVDRLFRSGEYRPPWLWSVVDVLERTRDLTAHVKSHPTAGGMRRGAHNCGACDRRGIDPDEEVSPRLPRGLAGPRFARKEGWGVGIQGPEIP